MLFRSLFAGTAILALAIIVLGTDEALAGKGGPQTSEPSSISLVYPVGGDVAAASVTSGPSLGSSVGFASHAAGLAGWEYPMVAVWCYQDSVLVYMQLAHPEEVFVLGGGSSDWKTLGGSADCEAYLYAYGSKGPRESIRTLASAPFFAAGAQ